MDRYRTLLKSFKESVGFVDHQINSFNKFIDYRLQKIIDEIGEIELETPELSEFRIKLGKVRLSPPQVKEADGAVRTITPMEARLRDLSYTSTIFVEMVPIINGVEQDSQEVKLGELPIMLKSNLCVLKGKNREELVEEGEDPDDPGGYFIINGTERVIVMMEEVLSNRPIIELKNMLETARINSESASFVQRHMLERKNGLVTISFANLKKLPVVVLLRALGMETDKEIIESISTKPEEMQEIYFNLYEFDVKSVEEAKNHIGNMLKIPQKEYRDKRVIDVMDKYLLPHLGQHKSNRMEKAQYLAKVVRKMVKLGLEKIDEQDIDHYANKRIKMVGDFLEILFRSVMLGKYGLISRIVYSYQKLVKRGKMPSISSIVESDYLSKRIVSHMATGQWIGGRTGVCQRFERTNYIRSIAHLRNVISPLSSTQEHFEARALHPTQWGRLCAAETPEGVNIGLRKYLATMAVISETITKKEMQMIEDIVKKEITHEGHTIFLDGRIAGMTTNLLTLLTKLREKRRSGTIPFTIGIAVSDAFEEVHINTDAGRLMRPIVVVRESKSMLTNEHLNGVLRGDVTWHDLLKQGIIEYLDAEEEDNALVALPTDTLTKDHTHVEIHPALILGLSASLVPFPSHNRGDRVNYGAKMSGQALGVFATNFLVRTDTKADVLAYPQVPLINTILGDEVGLDNHAQGQNLVIAIMSYKGYNMEDGIVFNRASVERGIGRSFFFRSYVTEEKKYWGIDKDEIKIPDKSISGYRTEEAYAHLDSDGIINREIMVEAGDVLVGKISPLRFYGPMESFMVEAENRRETSEIIRPGEEGIVDNVFVSETVSGNKLVKVTIRSERIAEQGDKFTSRHGQKGIISLLEDERNLPFTQQGIVPDIFLNPHAIPSRMTIGQLLEVLASKVSALNGTKIDATIFNKEVNEESLRELLRSLGYRDDGKECMYDGVTGVKFDAQILVGPCYYQKLHHMVANKIQARARGPVTLLTKQPTAGRAKQGGLRLGEMEKDCLIAHGAALLLKERFSSDRYKIPVCETCGLVAVEDFAKGKKFCLLCKKSKVIDVEIAYAFKLMLDELKCLGIYPKLIVK
ncbi:MAG: DNA-directed RNA polymerase subunit B [Candidatus Aenigmarchaeota archaeon]|nr:DNA-directed RNA polymerase subunit B [Candidatus Aenigmarchaeota archaeon]